MEMEIQDIRDDPMYKEDPELMDSVSCCLTDQLREVMAMVATSPQIQST